MVYPLSILNTPTEQFIENLEVKFINFLWDDKRPKLSKNIIFQPSEKGGISFPNIRYFIMAQKVTWIKRMLNPDNNAKWKLFHIKKIKDSFGLPDFETFFSCNIKCCHIPRVLEGSFLGDLIKVWANIHFKQHGNDISINDISRQILWLNSNICSQNMPLVNRKLAKRGLMYVGDLIDGRGYLKHCHILSREYNESNFIEILRILYSVPKAWVEKFRVGHDHVIPFHNAIEISMDSKINRK